MKKIAFLLFGLMLGMTVYTQAQSNDSLIGTWDIVVEDTPQGNVNVHLTIERIDGKLKAKFKQAGSNQETSISNISEQDNGITMYFFAEGYDLYMTVRPAEEDTVSGYLVDQFPVKGKRIKS
ncbi:hypothetical protein [Cecembia rubra]|uniref:Lipocalin-like protein n=1 Tax=Cecembia rubra TaxID=1485585 RepID=A0A2P8E4G2_9BACT|nr:hypothetical protein [Cecembia rubra]PSL04356.1 hypothetical protein CLV48_10597 [Cecembia rubra]